LKKTITETTVSQMVQQWTYMWITT